MSDTRTYYDMNAGALGKSIKAIDGDIMTLSDGTVLQFEDTSGCCAYFNSQLEVIDLTDNAITAVEHVDGTPENEWDEAWSLHVLSNHKLIAKVNIEGNATSGYYCHSINLLVKYPEAQK